MSLLGLRVVRLDIGEPAGVDHQFVRWVLWFVDGFAAAVLHRHPGTTPDGLQWDAARQFDDMASPPRPLT